MSLADRRVFTIVGALEAFAVLLLATSAAARTYALPDQAPVVAIEVPDSWDPRQTAGGIDGSEDDGVVQLWIDLLGAPNREAAEAAALAKLAKQGVTPRLPAQRRALLSINGFDAAKIDFSGTYNKGEANITVILVDSPEKSGFIAVCYWGDNDALETVGNDLQRVTDSIAGTR